MPKRRKRTTSAKRQAVVKKDLWTMLTNLELWVGLATIAVAVFLVYKIMPIVKERELPGIQPSPVVTSVPTPSVVAQSGTIETVVRDGESYYTVTVRVCGTGNSFEYVQAMNNFKPLYVGDTVIVSCE